MHGKKLYKHCISLVEFSFLYKHCISLVSINDKKDTSNHKGRVGALVFRQGPKFLHKEFLLQLDQYSTASLDNEEDLASISFDGSFYSTSLPTIRI